MKNNIIDFLNNYWNKKNVFFGRKIHELKPKNKDEWLMFLKKNNFFFIKNLKKYGFFSKDHKIWIWYLKNSFWKLYESETKAINFFKNNFKKDLLFAPHIIDGKFGIDFLFDKNNFLIVKSTIIDDNINFFLKKNDLKKFKFKNFNIDNCNIYLYFSDENKLCLYDKFNNYFKEITQLV